MQYRGLSQATKDYLEEVAKTCEAVEAMERLSASDVSDAPDQINAKIVFRRLKKGERRKIGDYWLDQFSEMREVRHVPIFTAKITDYHCPHYRPNRWWRCGVENFNQNSKD